MVDMRRSWIIFLLVLVISVQLVVLSSFHDVEVDGFANGNSVIAVAKWNYVQGSVHITVIPMGPVELVFSDGSSLNITTQYSFTIQLPRTGDVFGNGAMSGPLALSQEEPLNLTLAQNVGSVSNYVSSIKQSESTSQIPIDLTAVAVYGEAEVVASGFGIGL
jgi:hypothetical protein